MVSWGCALVAVVLTICQYKGRFPQPEVGKSRFRVTKMLLKTLYGLVLLHSVSGAAVVRRQSTGNIDKCPGYSASDIVNTATGLTAKLTLAGPACNVYGADVQHLLLAVNHDSGVLFKYHA
jgi:hypothetical protein